MKDDIRPPRRTRPVQPAVTEIPSQSHKKPSRRLLALTFGAITVVAAGAGAILQIHPTNPSPEASRRHQDSSATVADASKAKPIRSHHHRWSKLAEVPGVPDPVDDIPGLVTSVADPIVMPTPSDTPSPIATPIVANTDLTNPAKKELAMQLVSSAENSSLNWRAQYGYIEDIGDGRGYTGGIIGFTSGTHDMLQLVEYYTQIAPNNVLAKYVPALKEVDGSDSHDGLDPNFTKDWKTAASDPKFQEAQNHLRDLLYFDPAVKQAKTDGLHALGQFVYYDAMVMHGSGEASDPVSFEGIRAKALSVAKPPSQGGSEATYLSAFLDARKAAMLTEAAHDDTSRVDTEQRAFLQAGNLSLSLPLVWKTYGDSYNLK